MKVPPFYISSRGHSATAWITKSLSKHPDIVCFHGTRSIPPKPSGRVPDMSPEEFIDGLVTCSQSSHGKVFGAIHGFYGTVCKKAVEDAGGRFAAVIRHPINRIHSCFIHAHRHEIVPKSHEDYESTASTGIYEFISTHNMDKVKSRLTDKGELMISPVEKIFFNYCKSFIYLDLICIKEAGKTVNFKMEDLVSTKEEFERMFRYITQDKLPYDRKYRDAIDFKKKINTHTKKQSPEEIYGAWPDSFRYLFHMSVQENGLEQVYLNYEDFGYSLPTKALKDFSIRNREIIAI